MIGLFWSLIDTSTKVSRKGQDHGGEKVHSTCLKGALPKFLIKWLIVFLKVVRTKHIKWIATKLLELHQGDQILVVTYKNTGSYIHKTLLSHNPPIQNWINTSQFVHAKLKKWINDSSNTHWIWFIMVKKHSSPRDCHWCTCFTDLTHWSD